jgi:RHS repeat-associated protein
MTSIDRTINGNYPDVATIFGYDNGDRLTTIQHEKITTVGGPPPTFVVTPLATYTYAYDSVDRLTTETNAEGTVTYSYDNTNQLTAAGGSRSESYGYDANGNRNTTGYTVGSGNKLSAAPGYTYTYDSEGNLTAKTETGTGNVTTYSYDYRNRMTGVTEKNSGGSVIMQATYTYDALNRRIGTKVDADGAGAGSAVQTWMVYDNRNIYADFNGSGNVTVRYLSGPALDALIARTDSGGTTAWYLPDQLGSVRDIANTSGTVVDHVSYASFGSILSESSPGNGDRFKFTGREYDSAADLYYYRARYYDASAGRFISQDPLGFSAGDFNTYRYVVNGPTDANDPTGEILPVLIPLLMAMAIGGAIGGATGLAYYLVTEPDRNAAGAGMAFLEGFGLGALGGALGFCLGPGVGVAVGSLGLGGTMFGAMLAGGITDGLIDAGVQLTSIAIGAQPEGYKLDQTLNAVAIGFATAGIGYGLAKASRSLANAKIPACFPRDTPVGTESGLRPIWQVEAGERVWAYDFEAGMWRLCLVECRHDTSYDGLIVGLEVDGIEVTSTAHHPFWVVEGHDLENRPDLQHVDTDEDRGKSLLGRWVNSHDLRVGDVIVLRADSGQAKIRRIVQRSAQIQVCNLTIRDLHTFAVGGMQALVHNSSASSTASNVLPNEANVVRGGLNTPESVANGMATHPSGVTGVSVESAPNLSIGDLSKNIPHNKIGTTTVGEVRKVGGDVIPTSGRSPNHATLTGLTPAQISELLSPPIPNPSKSATGGMNH